MRWFRVACLAAVTSFPGGIAAAAEQGLTIRAADLMAQPFLDAQKAGPVAANQAVTILERRGGWIRVDAGGRTGWVRMLNVRLPAAARGTGASASLFRTGSSGRTVTTGVKGIGEEEIRNAMPDHAALARLETMGVDAAQARVDAQRKALQEPAVPYLKPKAAKGSAK